MKKIIILSDAQNYHTQKWVKGLAGENYEIILVSLGSEGVSLYHAYDNVKVVLLGVNYGVIRKRNTLYKITYLSYVQKIKSIIEDFKPDLLHSHYASSYGLLGALTGFKPYIISVWGTDVYDFPRKSIIHKLLLKYSFSKASLVLSTSNCMAIETRKYTKKTIKITPFGVDVERFYPIQHSNKPTNSLIVGTVKALKPVYGIDVLLKAFHIVLEKTSKPVTLLIVGNGECEKEYKKLAKDLGIQDKVTFKGYVEPSEIPEIINTIDVFAALSHRESFGVAAIEAMSCGRPVVVTNVDGFKEVVPELAGKIVDSNNASAASLAISELIHDDDLRINMGKKGREYVLKNYDFNDNLQTMKDIYHDIISKE